jgi:probable metal-binding protein
MNNIRHIHEVLEIIYGTDEKYTTSSLITELKQTFGEEVNFTSCSDNVFPLRVCVKITFQFMSLVESYSSIHREMILR